MASYKVVAQRELEHTVIPGSDVSLSPNEDHLYFSYGYNIPFASIRLMQMDANGLLEVKTGAQLFDAPRNFVWDKSNKMMACVTYKKLFIFNAKDLILLHKVGGIGFPLDKVAFDRSSRYLVVGSERNPMVKFVDPWEGKFLFRKKLGHVTKLTDGLEDNEIIFGYGPSGRIACYDCSTQKIKYEIACPPFADFVRIGNELILGVGSPAPTYYISADMLDNKEIRKRLGFDGRPKPVELSSFLPSVSEEGIEKLRPSIAWKTIDHRPESKVSVDAPVPGSEDVHNIVGFSHVNLLDRTVSKIHLLDPLLPSDVMRMKLSRTGKHVYLTGTNCLNMSYGAAIRLDDYSLRDEWIMPEDEYLAVLLDEGKKAISIHRNFGRQEAQTFSLLTGIE